MNLYGIVGDGGFGREVIPVAHSMLKKELSSNFELVFITENKQASFTNHYSVLSFEEFFLHEANNKFFNIAIANYSIRKRIATHMINEGIKPFNIYAPNTVILDHNEIAEGAIFCPFTMVTSNAKIGKYFHANIYSYIAHDCIIGDYVTFAPGVHCNGNIIIEDDVYVGTGVIIKQGKIDEPLIIGKGATLGMGAVVTKSVLPNQTVVGNPAKLFERKIEPTG